MGFLSLPKKFSPVVVCGVKFYISSDARACLKSVEGFLQGQIKLPPLDLVEECRGVYLIEDQNAVLKFNRLRHWKMRLRKSIPFLSSDKYCLLDEFKNLSGIFSDGLAPKVLGYGYKRKYGLLRDEYLLLEFLEGSVSLDAAIADGLPVRDALAKVFPLFKNMLLNGFVHMDPHPKNIMVLGSGELRLIDFECCALEVGDYSFSLAFCLGYFYHFWISRYISESEYDAAVIDFLEGADTQDEIFWTVYSYFKLYKVSRSLRYRCFFSEQVRRKFVETCVRTAAQVANSAPAGSL